MAEATVGWTDDKEICVKRHSLWSSSHRVAQTIHQQLLSSTDVTTFLKIAQNLKDWSLWMLLESDTDSDQRLRHNDGLSLPPLHRIISTTGSPHSAQTSPPTKSHLMNSQEQPSVIYRFDLSSACSRSWKDGASYTFNTPFNTITHWNSVQCVTDVKRPWNVSVCIRRA